MINLICFPPIKVILWVLVSTCLWTHAILSKIKYHIFRLSKVNDARQELTEKCLWNEKQSNLNDGKSFPKLSVQIYTPLKENVYMEKI